jgi:hypothetical protein
MTPAAAQVAHGVEQPPHHARLARVALVERLGEGKMSASWICPA